MRGAIIKERRETEREEGWRLEGGGLRVEGEGLDFGGWRLEVGGWRMKGWRMEVVKADIFTK